MRLKVFFVNEEVDVAAGHHCKPLRLQSPLTAQAWAQAQKKKAATNGGRAHGTGDTCRSQLRAWSPWSTLQTPPCGGLSCVFTEQGSRLSLLKSCLRFRHPSNSLILSNSQHTRDSLVLRETTLLPALYLEESEFSDALSSQP